MELIVSPVLFHSWNFDCTGVPAEAKQNRLVRPLRPYGVKSLIFTKYVPAYMRMFSPESVKPLRNADAETSKFYFEYSRRTAFSAETSIVV